MHEMTPFSVDQFIMVWLIFAAGFLLGLISLIIEKRKRRMNSKQRNKILFNIKSVVIG